MVFHGLDVTHLDSLAHIFWDGKMYGGAPASMVSDRQGALDARRAGRVARASPRAGVLLDIARLRGVDVLAADDHVYPEDLEAAEQAAGVRVEPGDVLLMRTGESGARRGAEPRLQRQQAPLGLPGGVPAVAARARAWRCSAPTWPRTRRRRATGR